MLELLKTKVSIVLAIITGVGGIGTVSWATGDYLGIRPIIKREWTPAMDQVEQMQLSIQLMQFQLLSEKRKNQALTTEEMMQLCQLGKLLGIDVAGCQ